MTSCSAPATTRQTNPGGNGRIEAQRGAETGKPEAMSGAQTPRADGADPSMEDILASIRRILSEEDPATTEAEPAADSDTLVLDETMLAPDSAPAPAPAQIPAVAPPLPVAPPEPVFAAPPAPLAEDDGRLLAPETEAVAAQAVSSLMRSLASDRHVATHRGGPTIEDLVREEIRPLLKSWLDEHLPPLVERVVRAEIERLSAQGR